MHILHHFWKLCIPLSFWIIKKTNNENGVKSIIGIIGEMILRTGVWGGCTPQKLENFAFFGNGIVQFCEYFKAQI